VTQNISPSIMHALSLLGIISASNSKCLVSAIPTTPIMVVSHTKAKHL